MDRAYALLDLKSVDDERRILRGIATTASVDKMDDVVEPEGAQFSLPIPFLWQHLSSQPVGHVTKATVRKTGIEVEIQLQKTDTPGPVRDRLESAWQDIRLGLVRGLSIGFKPIETARIEGSYGIRFLKWLWVELSGVTIPANGDCSITSIKSIDTKLRAASGREQRRRHGARPAPAGLSSTLKMEGAMRTIQEQIDDLKTTRGELVEDMKGFGDVTELDAEQATEYDGVAKELGELDVKLGRLNAMAKAIDNAAPVDGSSSEAAARSRRSEPQVKQAAPEPGIRLARYARCIGLSRIGQRDVVAVAKELYGQRDPEIVAMVKAAGTAVSALTSGNSSALIGNEGGFADFVDFLRSRTIIGRFGQGGIPSLRSIPFRVPLISQATGGAAYWVGEGDGKPLTRPTFGRTELAPLKVAVITAVTMETLRDSSPSAERVIRDDLAAAVAERIDISFIDPANPGSANVSPASITDSLSAVSGSGGDADAVRADARAAMQKFVTAKNPLTSGVWVMSSSTALGLSVMVNAMGVAEFPGITLNGGTFFGIPVITSEYVDGYVALVNASDIWLGDEGGIAIDMSSEASLQMVAGDDEGATQHSGTPVATAVVSMFQTNSVAFRAERTINWARRRASGVALITDVTWGDEESEA